MKKIITAIIFCTGFIFNTAFAEDDSIDAHIANTLFVLFKITNTCDIVNANDYQQSTFVYNGIVVTAFKSKSTNWTGFFKKIPPENLPPSAVLQIKNMYKSCSIENATLYFNGDGDIIYYAEVIVSSKCIVLKIQPSGDVKVFDCMNRKQ